jgi:hypothetical protein
MTDIAFTVHGRGITVAQREAGMAAMQGQFRALDVRAALARAGVEDEPGQFHTAERAADRLMQAERKRGTIRAINNKNWERVA